MSEEKVTRKHLEWCLYNYKANKVELRILKRNLKGELEAARDISGVDYNQEKVSETNETSDPTGDYLKREEQIKKRYTDRIEKKENHIELVETVLFLMNVKEKDIIHYRYINGMEWVDVGEEMNLSPGHCRKIRVEAIENILESLNKEEKEEMNVK